MKALFSQLAVAALICVVQSRSRGYGQRPMQLHQSARRQQHRPEDLTGKEALAIAMLTLMQVQDLFEKHQWADLYTYPDLSVTLPGHEQVHAVTYLTPAAVARGHPWIVLQLPTTLPKDQPRKGFDQYYPNYHYPNEYPRPQGRLEDQVGKGFDQYYPNYHYPNEYPRPQGRLEDQLGKGFDQYYPNYHYPNEYPRPQGRLEDQVGKGFDQYYPNYHYPNEYPRPQYSAASRPVPRPVPPPRTARPRPHRSQGGEVSG